MSCRLAIGLVEYGTLACAFSSNISLSKIACSALKVLSLGFCIQQSSSQASSQTSQAAEIACTRGHHFLTGPKQTIRTEILLSWQDHKVCSRLEDGNSRTQYGDRPPSLRPSEQY